MKAILLAEADERIAAFFVNGANLFGFDVTVSDDGHEAMVLAAAGAFETLVIDDRVPNGEILAAVREWEVPRPQVIIVTGRGRPTETAAQFDVPLDDVLTKPFRFQHLVARIGADTGSEEVTDPSMLRVGRATLDLGRHQLHVGRRRLQLTHAEFDLVHALFRRPEMMLTGEELLRERRLARLDYGGASVDALLNGLNRKLGERLIAKVKRVGYRLEVDTGLFSG